MGLIVDANIVKGFFQEAVLGKGHDLTGSAMPIFDKNFRKHPIYLDDEGNLHYEWRAVVDPEWFDVWFTDLIRDDVIRQISAPPEKNFRKELAGLGFPAKGRDIWYARVANALTILSNFAILVSEDLDFYEPKEKGCSSKRRNEILLKELGSVRRHLRKKRSIYVKPVARLVSDYANFCR
jgi:hypothetical protein